MECQSCQTLPHYIEIHSSARSYGGYSSSITEECCMVAMSGPSSAQVKIEGPKKIDVTASVQARWEIERLDWCGSFHSI